MRIGLLRWGLVVLGVGLGGCSTVIHGSLAIGDGSAYVVGARQSLTWEPTVWRCPAAAGTPTKCTQVTLVGTE
jgi:hypothetical protein